MIRYEDELRHASVIWDGGGVFLSPEVRKRRLQNFEKGFLAGWQAQASSQLPDIVKTRSGPLVHASFNDRTACGRRTFEYLPEGTLNQVDCTRCMVSLRNKGLVK